MAVLTQFGSSPNSSYCNSSSELSHTLCACPRLISASVPSVVRQRLCASRDATLDERPEKPSPQSIDANHIYTDGEVDSHIKTDCNAKVLSQQLSTLSSHEMPKESQKPSCCRKLIHQFEKELTFRPKLNPSSLKLAKQSSRRHQPLVTRLSDGVKKQNQYHDANFTFSPKLNATSLKLAQERAGKLQEIQDRAAAMTAMKMAEFYSEYTFKPHVLNKSTRIVQKLDTGFLDRQQQHLARKQKLIDEALSPPQKLTKRQNNQATSHSPSSDISPSSIKATKLSTLNERSPIVKQSLKKHGRSQTAPALPVSSPSKPLLHKESVGSLLKINLHSSLKCSPSSKNTSKQTAIKSTLQNYQGLLKKEFKSLNEADRVRRVKVLAEKATRCKKIFHVKGGYQTIRKALRSRGWIEIDHHNSKTTHKKNEDKHCDSDGDEENDMCDDCDDDDISESESESDEEVDEEYLMLCRAVRNSEPNFIWSLRRSDIAPRYLKKDQIVNHFSGAWFTTKFGLCSSLQNLPWYRDIDPDTFFPRCYLLTSQQDKESFKDDYQLTAAFNILKIVACEINQQLANIYYDPLTKKEARVTITSYIAALSSPLTFPSHSATSTSGSSTPVNRANQPSRPCSSASRGKEKESTQLLVPEEVVLLSIKACETIIAQIDHSDIDGLHTKPLTEEEWSTLLSHYYNLVFHDGNLACSSNTAMRAEELLIELGDHFPQLSMDGIRNVWIVKPGALSRGRGIVCMDHLEDIEQLVQPSILMKESRWVIQKYIERPLLIRSTKFDIRQWFLVTDWNPLTMWMYKDCYLRFSSQLFSLKKLDTSIHLCNNSVQKYMTISPDRDSELPSENMWDSATFQSHLRSIGEGDKWKEIIYPGMKQAIINVLQVSQERINDRKNSFELYGADFMITADFKPWLIEVNCSPTMERNTTVTKRLCKQVMEDTIKVVIDRRNNKDCDTGQFELAYKQTKIDVPPYMGLQLRVDGSSIGGSHKHHTTAVPAVDLGQSFDFSRLRR